MVSIPHLDYQTEICRVNKNFIGLVLFHFSLKGIHLTKKNAAALHYVSFSTEMHNTYKTMNNIIKRFILRLKTLISQ